MTAYDTTGVVDHENPCSAAVAQEGMLELLDMDFKRILRAGISRIEYRKALDRDDRFSKDVKDQAMQKLDNVVKVNFGKIKLLFENYGEKVSLGICSPVGEYGGLVA